MSNTMLDDVSKREDVQEVISVMEDIQKERIKSLKKILEKPYQTMDMLTLESLVRVLTIAEKKLDKLRRKSRR